MSSPTNLPPRRKRLQFSLRTLMIAVIVYGCLWVLIIRVGGSSLAQHYAEHYRDIHPAVNGTKLCVQPEHVFGWIYPDRIEGHAVSPAPFVLIWKWDSDSINHGGESDSYVWLVGWRIPLRVSEKPTFFNSMSKPW